MAAKKNLEQKRTECSVIFWFFLQKFRFWVRRYLNQGFQALGKDTVRLQGEKQENNETKSSVPFHVLGGVYTRILPGTMYQNLLLICKKVSV